MSKISFVFTGFITLSSTLREICCKMASRVFYNFNVESYKIPRHGSDRSCPLDEDLLQDERKFM